MGRATCIIAFGSNLGDRLRNLVEALEFLGLEAAKKSSVYQTSPVDCERDTDDFYNSVVELFHDGSAQELHRKTVSVERKMGRPGQREVHAPRVIDLDILAVGDEIVETEHLTVPHPRLAQRKFVLEPLAEILPDLRLPGHEKSVAELLETLESSEPPLTVVTREW